MIFIWWFRFCQMTSGLLSPNSVFFPEYVRKHFDSFSHFQLIFLFSNIERSAKWKLWRSLCPYVSADDFFFQSFLLFFNEIFDPKEFDRNIPENTYCNKWGADQRSACWINAHHVDFLTLAFCSSSSDKEDLGKGCIVYGVLQWPCWCFNTNH